MYSIPVQHEARERSGIESYVIIPCYCGQLCQEWIIGFVNGLYKLSGPAIKGCRGPNLYLFLVVNGIHWSQWMDPYGFSKEKLQTHVESKRLLWKASVFLSGEWSLLVSRNDSTLA